MTPVRGRCTVTLLDGVEEMWVAELMLLSIAMTLGSQSGPLLEDGSREILPGMGLAVLGMYTALMELGLLLEAVSGPVTPAMGSWMF